MAGDPLREGEPGDPGLPLAARGRRLASRANASERPDRSIGPRVLPSAESSRAVTQASARATSARRIPDSTVTARSAGLVAAMAARRLPRAIASGWRTPATIAVTATRRTNAVTAAIAGSARSERRSMAGQRTWTSQDRRRR